MPSPEGSPGERRAVPLREAADSLGIRDVRTLRRELARRGLPILRLGRRICVRGDDLRTLERLSLTYELGESPTDIPVLVKGRAAVNGAAMATTRQTRRRRKETLAPHLYREHRAVCAALGSIDASFSPTTWREFITPGLWREHVAACTQWRTARERGTASRCNCCFSCDLVGGPDP